MVYIAELKDAIRRQDMLKYAMLLTQVEDINMVYPELDHHTLLHYVIRRSQSSQFPKLLVDNGANTEIRDRDGSTPLLLACHVAPWSHAKMLIDAEADEKIKDNEGAGPLHNIAFNSHFSAHSKLTPYLLSRGAEVDARDEQGHTPLYYACRENRDSMVKHLLDYGADISVTDKWGSTIFDLNLGAHVKALLYGRKK